MLCVLLRLRSRISDLRKTNHPFGSSGWKNASPGTNETEPKLHHLLSLRVDTGGFVPARNRAGRGAIRASGVLRSANALTGRIGNAVPAFVSTDTVPVGDFRFLAHHELLLKIGFRTARHTIGPKKFCLLGFFEEDELLSDTFLREFPYEFLIILKIQMSNHSRLFAFSLGREFKLSIAEIASVCGFQAIVETSPELAVVRFPDREAALGAFSKLGGSIRLFEIQSDCPFSEFLTKATEYYRKKMVPEAKNSFALAYVGPNKPKLSELALRVKKFLKTDDLSIRSCNVDDRTINAASFKKDHLSKTLLETAILEIGKKSYFAITLACQDVDAFAARDLAKGRDMEVGMLPPKLARMMINLTLGRGGAEALSSPDRPKPVVFAPKRIYDPFCGLGTVLIEALDLGFKDVLGSDISERMAISTAEALEAPAEAAGAKYLTMTLDAKDVASKPESFRAAAIVTEGYLGEVQSAKTVSEVTVAEQKKILLPIYDGFFKGLRDAGFRGTTVMCVPFWEVSGKYVYFEEFFDVLKKYGFYSDSLLPREFEFKSTKFGSLLYKRQGQTVGREIVRVVPGRGGQRDEEGRTREASDFRSGRGGDSRQPRGEGRDGGRGEGSRFPRREDGVFQPRREGGRDDDRRGGFGRTSGFPRRSDGPEGGRSDGGFRNSRGGFGKPRGGSR